MERRIWVLAAAVVIGAASLGWASPSHHTTHSNNKSSTNKPAPSPTVAAPVRGNPLLPPAVALEGFFVDLSLVQKLPSITPAGFESLYTAEDWASYRTKFGAEADELSRRKSSGQMEFAAKLIEESNKAGVSAGLQRLLLIRAGAICYRSTGGFATANKAVEAYQKKMDIKSPAQVGALWTIANQMSRMAVTPKAERIRYSGIAAKANMQLAILMLEADQIEAADKIIKMVGYHDGWLKSDKAIKGKIAATRAAVRQTATMMEYLGTQYQPAIRGDDSALMALYLYGRFVKNDAGLVADFPGRKPSSAMAQLAGQLEASQNDPLATFSAAESLRIVAGTLPDGVLKQRTLYAALERYRKFIAAPETEHERVKRTLARMAIEGAHADGAKAGVTVKPFEVAAPATQPALHVEVAAR